MGTSPYCSNCGHVFPHHQPGGPCASKDCTCSGFNSPKSLVADDEPAAPSTESNLVAHARRELEIINSRAKPGDEYTPQEIDGFLKVVQAFADMGHSGGSAPFAIGIISDLLQFKPLAPLTDDPDEWEFHGEEKWGEKGGVWQNKRHSEAFSHDGGKSYYLLSEVQKGTMANGRDRIMHHSMAVNKDPEPRPDIDAAPYDR